MRTFIFTILAIEILYRAFGDPRHCLTIVFWRWLLGSLDATPCGSSQRNSGAAAIDPARRWHAENQLMWERRFDSLAEALATPALF